MTTNLLSPGALQVVIMMTTRGAHSDDKVSIVATVDFRYYTR